MAPRFNGFDGKDCPGLIGGGAHHLIENSLNSCVKKEKADPRKKKQNQKMEKELGSERKLP